MFHSQTTLILSALLFLVLPFMVALVLRPSQQPAVAWWCAAGVMAGSGIVLFGLRPYLPAVVSFHLANTLVMGSLLVWAQSLKMICGKPWSLRVLILYLAGCTGFYSILLEWATPTERGFGVRTVLAFLSFITAFWAWRLYKKIRSTNAAVIGSSYLFLSMVLLGQTLFSVNSIAVPNPFSNTWDSSLLAVTALITSLLAHYCYVGMMLDLAEKDRVQFQQARKGEVQTQFIGAELHNLDRKKRMAIRSGALAHELKQPLTSALMNAQMALRFCMPGMADRRQFLGLLDQIDGSIHRTVRILNRIRSESESAQLDMKPLDLRDVVSQSVALIKPELQRLHVNFKSEGEDKALICLGDHLALSQVFFNLLRNAVQAMGNQPLKRLTVSYLSDGLYAVVLVRDSGSGLSAEMLSTWGEPMTSTKSDGLGMGLAISRDIMNRHNGHLLLRNQMSGGAEAYVQLPLWTAAS